MIFTSAAHKKSQMLYLALFYWLKNRYKLNKPLFTNCKVFVLKALGNNKVIL